MGGGNVQAVVAGRSEHGVPPDRLGKNHAQGEVFESQGAKGESGKV